MGQAAGVAAALAVESGTLPHDLDIHRLQGALRQMGAKFGEIRKEQLA